MSKRVRFDSAEGAKGNSPAQRAGSLSLSRLSSAEGATYIIRDLRCEGNRRYEIFYFAPSALRLVLPEDPARWAGLFHSAPLALKQALTESSMSVRLKQLIKLGSIITGFKSW